MGNRSHLPRQSREQITNEVESNRREISGGVGCSVDLFTSTQNKVIRVFKLYLCLEK